MNDKSASDFSEPVLPSNRSTGLVFAVFFLLVAVRPMLHAGRLRTWAIVLSALFAFLAIAVPWALAPLTKRWMRLADTLHAIVSPIMLCFFFFLVVTPVGWLMRLSGKDPLKLKLDPKAITYWEKREPSGPAPGNMGNQF